MTTTRAYKVKGSTQDVTECGLCGRVDLKGTIVMAELDADGNEQDITYMGTDCAARAAGWTQSDVRKRTRTADTAAREAEWAEKTRKADAERIIYNEWLTKTYGPSVTCAADLMAAYGKNGLPTPIEARRRYRTECAA